MTPSDPTPGPATPSTTAVPITSDNANRDAVAHDPFDPGDPFARGYDPSTAAFRAALAASRADPDLELAFQGRLGGETARFRAWAEDYRRRGAGGCCWSGPPANFTPVAPEVLLERATAIATRRRRWRESPRGRLALALAQAEADADAFQTALDEARAAVDRGDDAALHRAEAASATAGRLQASALRLRAAASAAIAPASTTTTGATEQAEDLWRFTREACDLPPHPAPARGRRLEG